MQDYLKRNGPFSEQVAKFYISQLISALQYCETVEVSHPNINASNILIEESGNILLCGWTNSSQTIKNQTKSLPFRLGELIVEMLTSRKLFTSSSLKHDTYGKFLSAKHIHKLWE
jgi:serine/threonine protein kinase